MFGPGGTVFEFENPSVPADPFGDMDSFELSGLLPTGAYTLVATANSLDTPADELHQWELAFALPEPSGLELLTLAPLAVAMLRRRSRIASST